MRSLALVLIIFISLASCKSAKRTKIVTKKETTSEKFTNTIVNAIIENAQAFNGVRYKFGGIDRKGMDCSGLVYSAYKKENILLPRVSRDMAKKGRAISLRDVEKGDLLFFKTSKKRSGINHVGLVTNAKKGAIEFIHSTTSKGVITSSLSEDFWNNSFVEARRVL